MRLTSARSHRPEKESFTLEEDNVRPGFLQHEHYSLCASESARHAKGEKETGSARSGKRTLIDKAQRKTKSPREEVRRKWCARSDKSEHPTFWFVARSRHETGRSKDGKLLRKRADMVLALRRISGRFR